MIRIRNGSSEELGVGLCGTVLQEQILVPRPAITSFLSEFRGKTGLNCSTGLPQAIFWKIKQFLSILVLLGDHNPPGYWVGLGEL